MDSIARWSLGIRARVRRQTYPSVQKCCLHLSPASSLALSPVFHPTKLLTPDMSARDSRSLAVRVKWDQLMDSLSRDVANPSRVWNAYLELGAIMGFEKVPFQVQQQVLRKSVPPTDKLRIAAARRMQAGNRPKTPHIYESRLQTIIAHIRQAGRKPELDDYNFILEQFAAVGHQSGARLVFQELTHIAGVRPSFRTYGLCLQSIAHRLTLPCPYRFQTNMLVEASRMCSELLDDMFNRRVPLTSVNFDLVHRIFKETSDRATFEKLLKVGYGIDLDYPDRPPLEIQGLGIIGGITNAVESKDFKPLPFSTAALNTLVDMLGRTKQVSRMVMAYEVLTTPLPIQSPNSSAAQWEEDEDDEPLFVEGSSHGDTSLYEFPSAMPNTTTFKLLIRYTSKAKHAVFTRHYVMQAMTRDREVDAQLRADLSSKPLDEILSPNFAVNRGTFLPPYGMANRTRHFAFMRWCHGQTMLAWKRKKEDLAFYTAWRQKYTIESDRGSGADSNDTGDLTSISDEPNSSESDLEKPRSGSPFTPESPDSLPSTPAPGPLIPEVLQLDLNAPPPPPTIRKPFDLDRHISLLTRDVEEIGELVQRTTVGVQRLSQRVKERLGRRVWQGKDIFLMSRNERVHLSRGEWNQRVRFAIPTPRADRNSTTSDLPRPEHQDSRQRQALRTVDHKQER